MLLRTLLSITTLALLGASAASAEEAAPLSALAKMPVREVTVFKDGHAFVLHDGKMPVEPSGDVLMDYLPAPVLGTFWPYSADKERQVDRRRGRQAKGACGADVAHHSRVAGRQRRH